MRTYLRPTALARYLDLAPQRISQKPKMESSKAPSGNLGRHVRAVILWPVSPPVPWRRAPPGEGRAAVVARVERLQPVPAGRGGTPFEPAAHAWGRAV